MRYRSLTILLLSFIFVGEYNAQDIHLSQFYASDHLLNPSKMGDFEGDFRITGNYRNQWKQINPPVNKGITTFPSICWVITKTRITHGTNAALEARVIKTAIDTTKIIPT